METTEKTFYHLARIIVNEEGKEEIQVSPVFVSAEHISSILTVGSGFFAYPAGEPTIVCR